MVHEEGGLHYSQSLFLMQTINAKSNGVLMYILEVKFHDEDILNVDNQWHPDLRDIAIRLVDCRETCLSNIYGVIKVKSVVAQL